MRLNGLTLFDTGFIYRNPMLSDNRDTYNPIGYQSLQHGYDPRFLQVLTHRDIEQKRYQTEDAKPSKTHKFNELNNRFHQKVMNLLSGSAEMSSLSLVYSPFSLKYALDMLYLGAARETQEELGRALMLDNNRPKVKTMLCDVSDSFKNHNCIKMANGLFVNSRGPYGTTEIQPTYKDFINRIGKIADIDVKAINSWVSANTNGLIPQLLSGGLSPDLVAILINVIYFKSDWRHKFIKHLTKRDIFYPFNGTNQLQSNQSVNRTAEYMCVKEDFAYAENDLAQLVELPYNRTDAVFGVYLPKRGSVSSLNNSENLTALQNILRLQEVEVFLPKFRQESTHEFKSIMQKMGMNLIFDQNKADFGYMITKDSVPVHVSSILQKAIIIVDEEGTEAAAATAIMLCQNSIDLNHKKPVVFRADHPFLYYIRANGIVLFAGMYN